MADARFHLPFSIRIADAARHRDRAVVRQHVPVQRIERGIVDVRGEHALAQVVEDHDPRGSAQPAKGLLVQLGPDVRTGVEDQQADRLAAVAQRQHEQARAPVLAAVRIADHRAGAVVDLGLFAGGGLDHRAGFRRLAAAELADESPDALIAAGEAADVDQILPDRHGVAALREPQFDGFPEGFAGAGRRTALRPRFRPCRRLVERLPTEAGGHLAGRFQSGSVITSLAGFAGSESVVTSLAGFAGSESVVTSLAGFAGLESVITSLAGFAGSESGITSLAGSAGGRRPQPPGGRSATPAAFR